MPREERKNNITGPYLYFDVEINRKNSVFFLLVFFILSENIILFACSTHIRPKFILTVCPCMAVWCINKNLRKNKNESFFNTPNMLIIMILVLEYGVFILFYFHLFFHFVYFALCSILSCIILTVSVLTLPESSFHIYTVDDCVSGFTCCCILIPILRFDPMFFLSHLITLKGHQCIEDESLSRDRARKIIFYHLRYIWCCDIRKIIFAFVEGA